jgi:hypothetical protein
MQILEKDLQSASIANPDTVEGVLVRRLPGHR